MKLDEEVLFREWEKSIPDQYRARIAGKRKYNGNVVDYLSTSEIMVSAQKDHKELTTMQPPLSTLTPSPQPPRNKKAQPGEPEPLAPTEPKSVEDSIAAAFENMDPERARQVALDALKMLRSKESAQRLAERSALREQARAEKEAKKQALNKQILAAQAKIKALREQARDLGVSRNRSKQNAARSLRRAQARAEKEAQIQADSDSQPAHSQAANGIV